jgi:hypothetical protein
VDTVGTTLTVLIGSRRPVLSYSAELVVLLETHSKFICSLIVRGSRNEERE